MKTICSAIMLLMSGLSLYSQTTREEMIANPDRCGGIYYAYPAPTSEESTVAPPPKGYEPFYISHYGRHGSRYLISDKDYSRLTNALDKAHEAKALTELGEDFRQRMHAIQAEADGRDGELTPLGNRQHHDIADRMFKAYPEVFSDDAVITAQSTQVMRCAHSMFAFTEALKENNPKLRIPRESSRRNMDFLCWWTQESADFNSPDGPTKAVLTAFKEKQTDPSRLINALFSSPDYVKHNIIPDEFMWWVYWVAVDLQNMETDITLTDVLLPEEMFDLWQVFNFDFYIHNSAYPRSEGVHVNNAKHLLKNFIDKADEYIARNQKGATLRFGHDGNVVPFVALIQLTRCFGEENDPEKLINVWNDFHVSPMAANIQMIFYRNKNDDVIVKILHNERPVAVNMKSDSYPYYRWDDLKEYLIQRLDRPYVDFMGNNKK